jgi:hypothetical protein
MMTEKPKKSFGPESDFFQKLKGREVRAETRVGEHGTPRVYQGKLLWVDRYSIGMLAVPYSVREIYVPREMLLYKSALLSLALVDQ